MIVLIKWRGIDHCAEGIYHLQHRQIFYYVSDASQYPENTRYEIFILRPENFDTSQGLEMKLACIAWSQTTYWLLP